MKSSRTVPFIALAVSAAGLLIVLTNGPRRVDSAPLTVVGPNTGVGDPVAQNEPRANLQLDHERRVSAPGGATPEPEASEETPPGQESPKTATLAELQEFRSYVDATISEIRTEEAADELRALEERAAWMDATIATLEKRLELSAHQAGRMRSALLSQLDREAEYLQLWERGADEEILGELKARDLEAHFKELSGILTAKQLVAYRSRGGGD